MVFNLVIPGAVGGDLIKAAYLVRMQIKKNAGDRLDGDRPDPRAARPVHPGGDRRGRSPGGWRTRDVRKLIVAAWVAVLAGVLVLAAIFAQAFTRMFPRVEQRALASSA